MGLAERGDSPDKSVCGLLLSDNPRLDRLSLRTPRRHGEVLVAPNADAWAAIARENSTLLSESQTQLVGASLSQWRRRTREAVFGTNDRLIVMAGHQPEFYHPGVWAKFVAAHRFAESVGGLAVNLVTDADTPKSMKIGVPSIRGRELIVRQIAALPARSGLAFEDLPAISRGELSRLETEVAEAAGGHIETSPWRQFIESIRAAQSNNFVEQFGDGIRAINQQFGLSLVTRRLSQIWGGTLLFDLVENAPCFAQVYNNALRQYRERYHVRGSTRPMPDLQVDANNCELPLWAFRSGERRRRVFLRRDSEGQHLTADNETIVSLSNWREQFAGAHTDGSLCNVWKIRPRALMLTIWARLMLADLFIHGIGGAKYDEISDVILKNYYRIDPPQFACVTATLHIGLPESDATPEELLRLQRVLRDMQANPYLFAKTEIGRELANRRREVTENSCLLRESRPRDRQARRQVYREIQSLNAELLERGGLDFESVRQQLAVCKKELDQNQIARGREYFVGLYPIDRLGALVDALPAPSAFRV